MILVAQTGSVAVTDHNLDTPVVCTKVSSDAHDLRILSEAQDLSGSDESMSVSQMVTVSRNTMTGYPSDLRKPYFYAQTTMYVCNMLQRRRRPAQTVCQASGTCPFE
eukprot:3998854-Pleurochrysis_carterae.AAC.1